VKNRGMGIKNGVKNCEGAKKEVQNIEGYIYKNRFSGLN
jgi:hypothetical protein